jgi:hypothetical protein
LLSLIVGVPNALWVTYYWIKYASKSRKKL